MSLYKRISTITLIVSFILVLISCGGGDGSTPAPPADDKTPPEITATKPSSEQLEVNTRDFIEVTFNEAIANVDTNQIDIFAYDANDVLIRTRINLRADPFTYDPKKKTLTIKPEINALLENTKYQVTIVGIKDIAGNEMVGSCQWDFGTIRFKSFGIGKTGVCGTLPTAPGAVQNVAAFAGDSTVTVSWSAPITGDTVGYYKVEKAVNGAAFELVKDQISAAILRHVDNKAQNDASHIYRVTAGNAIGLGSAVSSSAVTPRVVVATTARVELISQSPASLNRFGQKMAFSPDGTTLIIGELKGDPVSVIDAGTAQVFTKSNGTWNQVQTITAQTPTKGASYGYSVAISKDGLVLAVGGRSANAVDLYTKSGANWNYSRTILPNGTTAASFGNAVAFHSNSSLLAIGDFQASPNGVVTSGSVQLFRQSGTNWVFVKELISPLPAASNAFGSTVIFSPDGTNLAVSEANGDSSAATDVGVVHLFTDSGGNWSSTQKLISKKPTAGFRFGGDWTTSAVHFSPDSNILAIGEFTGNNVQLFTRSGTNWSRGSVLTVANATGSFGVGVSFSASGNSLAIGEFKGSSNGISSAGNVYLFTKPVSNWLLDKTVTALVPTVSNLFGYSVFFSSVGNELAIFEYSGDTSAAADAGVVTIIDISQLP